MEGDRILRNILNNQHSNLVNEVENYLSPVKEFPAKLAKSSMVKYHTFSLKLLRCCIQGFQGSTTATNVLLGICKSAITKLKITATLLEELKKISECQIDRLIKLIYHVLMHLNKSRKEKEFFWFADSMLFFFQIEINANKTDTTVCQNSERNSIFEKVFEMQWKLATQTANNNMKIGSDEVLYLRLHAVLFVFKTIGDITKYGKYLENCLMNSLTDQKNKSVCDIVADINSRIVDMIRILYEKLVSYDGEESLQIKAITGYLMLLSFKFVLVYGNSKESIEQVVKMLSNYKNSGIWSKLQQAICDASNTRLLLLTGSGMTICKHAKTLKQLLLTSEETYTYIFETKMLLTNPKYTVILDIVKQCLTFGEGFCVNILIHLFKLVNVADEVINLTQTTMRDKIKVAAIITSADKPKSNVNFLCSQWHSFLCWCLQVFQSWFSQCKKAQSIENCFCKSSQSYSRENLLECSLNVLDKTIKFLSVMSENDIFIKEKEFHWLGLVSFNFGILAQTDRPTPVSVKFLRTALQMLCRWVKSNNCSDSEEVLSKMQQVNLVTKQKVLVESLVKIGDLETAASCIKDLIHLLFKFSSECSVAKEMIQSQINLWVKSKQRLRSKDLNKNRLLSKMMKDVSQTHLQFVMEAELKAYASERELIETAQIEELLNHMIDEFEEKDPSFASHSLVELATLSSLNLDLIERSKLCRKAIKLLEQTNVQQEKNINSQDILAMAYFHLGFFQYKMKNVKRITNHPSKDDHSDSACNDLESVEELTSADFVSSFNAALNIWTLHVQDVLNRKSDCQFEFFFKSIERSAKCLQLMGFIYSLLRQTLNSVHSFHLSSLLNGNYLGCNETPDMMIVTSCEVIRLLSQLFDVSSVIKVFQTLRNHKCNSNHKNIHIAIAEATICNRFGECTKAEKIIKDVLSDDFVLLKKSTSFFIKAEALMIFAFSQEIPRDSYAVQDQPILVALEALKILRSLFKLYFENNEQDEFNISDLNSMSPWTVLDRLLNCLLYLVQRYKMQGSIPEAKFHLKEAVLLCHQFSITQRELEFLLEEAEIDLILHENVKLPATLRKVAVILTEGVEREKDDLMIAEARQHSRDCSCDFCSDLFLLKCNIRYLILSSKCSGIGNDCYTEPLKTAAIADALDCAREKSKIAIKDLQGVLDLGSKKKGKKNVTFVDAVHNHVQSCDFEEILKDLRCLNSQDIARLLFYDESIELKCLNGPNTFVNSERLASQNFLKILRDEILSCKFEKLLVHNSRRAIAKLYYNYSVMLLQSCNGMKDVRLKWTFEEYLLNKSEQNSEFTETEESNVKTKTKRAVVSKRRRGKKSKKVSDNKNGVEEIDATSGSFAADVSQLCYEALSHLVPSLDCLLIKKFFNLLTLVTGYSNVEKATYYEQLSFAMLLKEQMQMRILKEMRKSTGSQDPAKMCQNKDKIIQQQLLPTISHQPFSFQNHSQLSEIQKSLPRGWRICSIRMSKIGKKRLITSRLQAEKSPILLSVPLCDDEDDVLEDSTINGLVRDLSSAFQTDPVEELEELLEESLQTLQTEDIGSWWQNRKRLNGKIEKVLDKVENKWLGCWKGIILGEREAHDEQTCLELYADQFCNECRKHFNISLPKNIVEVILDSYHAMDHVQVKKALQKILGNRFDEAILERFIEKAEQFENDNVQNKEPSNTSGKNRKSRRPQQKSQDGKVKRFPVILVLDKELQKIPWESMSIVRGQMLSRMPSAIFARLSLLNSKDLIANGVNTANTFYVLNPRNDLQNTQKTFEKWFCRTNGWTGISGKVPTEREYKNALQDYSMFVYCGHGNGQEFLQGTDVQRIRCKAVSFLMGCSSGKLQVKGELEARGMALNYLMAGCPAVVANLWDVTDKDIDRFLVHLLKCWLEGKSNSNLLQHMTDSRDACRLPYLIGASPVIYGLPMILNSNLL